ncbi:hypothetical protein PROFUN_04911 [Planoprotostelium fungivorum]|uniref:Pex N-terminal domain-containing protein n=1 Tax=Planoprotostelium fungivorum TaxID=1890364 RepID=A0A2P6NF63_9EUKA|nr:hypothetical protein PROFUN_04911 [Planoprotostelium fungivorum]
MFLSNLNVSDTRPSFFEMIAQQEMMPTLKPALRYIFSTLAARHPTMEWFANHNDEVFTFLLLLLENHHLKHYDASFAEYFYGLKRMRLVPPPLTTPTKSRFQLSSLLPSLMSPKAPSTTSQQESLQAPTPVPIGVSERRWGLFTAVAIPYIKSKMDNLYKEHFPMHQFSVREGLIADDDHPDNQHGLTRYLPPSFRRFIYNALMYGYPYFNAFYEASFFLYQLYYLYGSTNYYTPFLHAQGVTLQRLSIQQLDAQREGQQKRRNMRLKKLNGGPLPRAWKLVVFLYDLVLDYSRWMLPITIFLFKFLEWWYTESRLRGGDSLPLPPPPQPPKIARKGLDVPTDKSLCPLCKEKRTNTTDREKSISIGGILFCYPCLYSHVRDHHDCPVTLKKMEIDQIRKIYDA